MADTQQSLKKAADDDFFADDDPLAELARIVGYDSRLDAVKPKSTVRREPEFDLEDELLKEFELFEAPAVAPARPVAEPPVVQAAQLHDALPHPEVPEPEAAWLMAEAEPLTAQAPVESRRPQSHPVFELEDEIMREFAAFDARRAPGARIEPPMSAASDEDAAYAPASVETLYVSEPPARTEAEDDGNLWIEPEVSTHLSPSPDLTVRHEPASRAEPQFDLPAHTLAFDPAPVDEKPESHFADSLADDDYWADLTADKAATAEIEQDLDRFERSWQETPPAAAAQLVETYEADRTASVDLAMPAEIRSDDDWRDEDSQTFDDRDVSVPTDMGSEAIAAPIDYERESEAADAGMRGQSALEDLDVDALSPFEPAIEAVEIAPVAESVPQNPVAKPDFGLDDLLADVARFPVPETQARWRSLATPVAPRPEPEKTRDLLLAPVSHQPAEPAPVVSASEPVVVEQPIVVAEDHRRDVASPAIPVVAPVAVQLAQSDDDQDFEINLGDIEIDLEDLDLDLEEQDHVTAGPEALAAVAAAEIAPVPPTASYVPAAVSVNSVASEASGSDYSDLPFDPSQISGEEDDVETLGDLDVPEIPEEPDHHLSPVVPDYDIDVDAEMAHLFGAAAANVAVTNAAHPAKAANTGHADAWFAPTAPAANPSVNMDLDEFEKALEEDFRRSLTENRAAANPDIRALPSGYEAETYAAPSSSRRWMALAASTGVVLLLGAAGVYAWLSGESSIVTNGEPRVILADQTPTKVVPENKGGRTVPNQDKAVYDRVAGADSATPTQPNLVTSTEEPVDVVQKTLLPENLPMDEDIPGTNTEDTADPRLLPNAENDNVSTANKALTGVSPRKVRTMIVKADGTLVPREETDTLENAAADTKAARVVAPEVPDSTPASADTVSERLAAADPTPVLPVPEEADQTNTDASDSAPVSADPAKAADPVADTEIKDQAQTPVTPASADDSDALAEAAKATVEETAPVRQVTTTAVSEKAPVPESRPIDQPVNVIGTVTDQGNVTAGEKTAQDVAAADAAAAKPETTTLPKGTYVIQIASLPSEAEAQSSYNKLASRFGSVIGGRGVDIKKAQIQNKGTYYRVRIPAGTKEEAQALCSRYKSAGGSCLVSR